MKMYNQTEVGCEPHFVLTWSAPAYLSCPVDKNSVLKAVRKLSTNQNHVMKGARCSLDRQSRALEGALGHSWRLLAARERSWRPPGQPGTFPQASKTLQDDLGGLKHYASIGFCGPGDATGSEVDSKSSPGPPEHTNFYGFSILEN